MPTWLSTALALRKKAFARHFRAARPGEEALSVSLPELIALLRKRQPGTLTGIGMQEFSRALVAAGVERRHTEKGNRYRIVPLETSDFQDLYLYKKS